MSPGCADPPLSGLLSALRPVSAFLGLSCMAAGCMAGCGNGSPPAARGTGLTTVMNMSGASGDWLPATRRDFALESVGAADPARPKAREVRTGRVPGDLSGAMLV
ncbi:hypothetical protein V8C86DRAFT_2702426, partial [Haematococcus lacustris]